MDNHPWLRKLFVQRPDGLWDRVRKHQVTEEHVAYYDDSGIWCPVEGREQEMAEAFEAMQKWREDRR